MKLVDYLRTHKISANAFAKQLGVTASAITKLINDSGRMPDHDLRDKIFAATGYRVSANDFADHFPVAPTQRNANGKTSSSKTRT